MGSPLESCERKRVSLIGDNHTHRRSDRRSSPWGTRKRNPQCHCFNLKKEKKRIFISFLSLLETFRSTDSFLHRRNLPEAFREPAHFFGMKRSGGRIAESVTVIGGAAAKPADAEPYGAWPHRLNSPPPPPLSMIPMLLPPTPRRAWERDSSEL